MKHTRLTKQNVLSQILDFCIKSFPVGILLCIVSALAGARLVDYSGENTLLQSIGIDGGFFIAAGSLVLGIVLAIVISFKKAVQTSKSKQSSQSVALTYLLAGCILIGILLLGAKTLFGGGI